MFSDSYLTNEQPVNFMINGLQLQASRAVCKYGGIRFLPGCYSLIIDLKRKKTIQVGKLGEAVFSIGTYVYTGSAMRGLGARLKRHCIRKKKLRWHIDYLLTLQEARVRKIILYRAAPGQECRQNKRIAAKPGAVVILRNFGASDCKSGCPSHLFFFTKDRSRRSQQSRSSLRPLA